MARRTRTARDVAAVLSTYTGGERALVETALRDERLSARPGRDGRLRRFRRR